MSKIIDMIVGDIRDKKEWRAMESRAKKLPNDYRVVYKDIKHYLWENSGILTIDVFRNLLELFEEGAADGKDVLDITGKDVAAFCDELAKGEKTYFEKGRNKLNQDVAKQLKK